MKIEDYLNDSDEAGFEEAKQQAINEGQTEFFFDGKSYPTQKKILLNEDNTDN